jgi:uncharacterized protein
MRAALLAALMLLLPLMSLPAHAQAPTPTATAAIDPDVEAITRRLLKAMRIAETSLKLMKTQMSELVQMLENGPNRMPDRAIDIIVDEMQKVAPQAIDEIVDAAVVLYAQRFTKQEMQEIATFYETPVGQKAIRELSPLMLEASKIGQEIGQRLGQDAGQRAFARIQAEGIQMPRR